MTPDKIYNIGILAHVDAGKTTLTEQFLYLSGALRKAGNVDSGTTQTDWLPIERERGISVRSAQTSFIWKDNQINLIDTPGHVDFSGEVERSLAAIDGAVLVVSAVEGIQSHTENLWRALAKLKIPTIIFINKIDRAGSRFKELCEDIPRLLPCDGTSLLRLSEIKNEGLANYLVTEIPDIKSRIIEASADYNDEIAEAFLSGDEIDEKMLKIALASSVQKREIIPVFGGCAQKCSGVEPLLDAVIALLPSADKKLCESLSALIYKIEHDKTMGKIAHVRMYGGELHARDLIPSSDDEAGEKISQIRKFNGQKYIDVGQVGAGDIAALCGLKSAKIFDSIGSNALSDTYRLTHPFLSVKVLPKNEAELMPLLSALRELSDEDPFLNCRWEKYEREIIISCTGPMQLEVISSLLRDRYSLSADFSEPSVIYKETPSSSGFGFEAYTMPKPCWAVLKLKFDPLPLGSGVIYDGGNIPNNTCFYKYQEHIRRSFFDNLQQGPLGWEVTDFKATLVGAEHHTIHTHPLDFFVATPMAIMNGLTNIGTTLLEPFLRVRISAGGEYLGKVISHITGMRGEFDSPVITGDSFTLEASLPVATSLDYPVRLASLTNGKGMFFSVFDGYRPCPLELGKTAKRRGPNPLDRAKWILYARDAMTESSNRKK
ncbi:MAG: TetM/TetW/TetO/TetS family tetracycline resistance ribosomal protection protein [Oscillospiraceae bacterium]|nr:TetM/TetW/TetO/TetS family tetracycline resistance ribosomal protection protein [Oscillospiraceae bacterium]